ncbi:uncharacterized protein H6S33_004346 [Morchella sextelata]|uniref:uncharacterized protein n=1 Tax=Morchella sextelata TaxID=1174677 RepID=UPI001D044869|nr:uncharacterized protein H6S33_004346 [Morchella sextelata]KAH0605889.1 hypothetical protein H6S33_004346 [Morchella sextelata]
MSGPPSISSFQSDKPLLEHLTIDLLITIFSHTFMNPGFAILLPLAYRAQTYHYNSPPFIYSSIYAGIVIVLFVWKFINKRLAFGKKREFDWTEEVVVITGGSSGLGLLIAETYGMRGVSVAVLDVREPEGGEARNVAYYKCDVGDRKQVEAAAKEIERDLGTPTVLINNASIVHGKSVLDLTYDEIDKTFQSNTLSAFYTTKQFLPGMKRLNKGSLITISSVLSSVAPANTSAYSASKAALKAFHSCVTAELAGTHPGIKTLLVCPGQLQTPMFEGVDTPSNFFAPVLEPVEVAKEIIAAIDEGAGGIIAMPAYARWIGIMDILPVSFQRGLRWLSGCDTAMTGFKGRGEIKEEEGDDE